jgi:Holliday junction resolvase RusA-like endonuclease
MLVPDVQLFSVNLGGFEPHTVSSGKGHKNVKRELCEAIANAIGAEEIDHAKRRIRGKKVKVDVVFRLLKPGLNMTRTRAEKDLDNLLKPVMDALQTNWDNARKNGPGLGLIENDDSVYEIVARKEVVSDGKGEGLTITIFEL